jgi:transcriptional regulator with XRE-family HTH domain
MDDPQVETDPRLVAGAILRAARAYAGLSQRELAAKAGLAVSTIGRAEGTRGPTPSWAVIVRAVTACGCSISITPSAPSGHGPGLWRWEFEDLRDEAGRHLPAHLQIWPVLRASKWSSFHKFSCYANPPIPPYSYSMRPRRCSPNGVAAAATGTS